MVAKIRAAIRDGLDAIEANARADVKRSTIRLQALERQGLGDTTHAALHRLTIALAHFRLALIGRNLPNPG